MSSKSFGMMFTSWSLYPFVDAHDRTEASQLLNCGSESGCEGLSPSGSFLFNQYKIECTDWTTFFSCTLTGVFCVASFPDVLSMIYSNPPLHSPRRIGFGSGNPSYFIKFSSGFLIRKSRIISFHTGAIINPATFFSMGILLLLPAQAPITIDGVYPTIHAS